MTAATNVPPGRSPRRPPDPGTGGRRDSGTADASAGRASAGRGPAGRRLYRSADGRMLGGVARGLAGHLGLPVPWVRGAFAVLFLVDGLGALLYAAFWFVVPLGVGGVGDAGGGAVAGGVQRSAGGPPRPGPGRGIFAGRRDTGRVVALLAIVTGLVFWARDLEPGGTFSLHLLPLLVMAAGVALVWRQVDDARRARWTQVTRSRRLLPVARTVAGVLLVCVGVTGIVVLQGSTRHLGSALQAALAVLVGIALLAGPYVVRMTQDLSAERLMRIRAQERAEVAAHVHDSVLHTLTLIQRNASDPREVARLARAQERELRAWLHSPTSPRDGGEDEGPGTLAEAVRATAAEVEDHHGVPVEVVCVGDRPLDERMTAQVQAAREAMVNAAKYGGEGGPVQVYAEVDGRTVFMSVRDHGPGFDPEAVPADRMGVRESIVGRMRRNGGTATLRSAPDGGTVVELELEAEAEQGKDRAS